MTPSACESGHLPAQVANDLLHLFSVVPLWNCKGAFKQASSLEGHQLIFPPSMTFKIMRDCR